MTHRIEIRSIIPDTRAQVRKKKIHGFGFEKVSDVSIIDVYTIDKEFGKKQLQQISSSLTNPVNQESCTTNFPPFKNFSFAIEVGFLPGVTDNVGGTAKEIIEDLLKVKFKQDEHVYSSQVTFVNGDITSQDARKIGESLANTLIQRVHIKDTKQFKKDGGMDVVVPAVTLESKVQVDEVNLNVDEEELKKIGKSGIANRDGTRRGPLALDLIYMKTIQKYFNNLKRKPTDIELESISQTWSEHCKHTIFADPIDDIKHGLYKTYIKAATNKVRKKKGKKDFSVSVFTDNSGAIEFDDDYLVTHKVETHNSPSALDPFGGAITGIVGVNRDALGFGLGAKPVINTYGFCFGDPRDESPLYKGSNFTQKMLSSKRIMLGVIDGVNAGGNCSGIPTPQGFLMFDKRFQGKPLVFVGTVGLIPKKIKGQLAYKKKAQPGDHIVMVGGRVGQDGVHGATFSSEVLDTGSPATAVQIGDPITQKKLSDAIVKEARDQLLFNSITDNGAGGISCSVAEMAKESGGFHVILDDVPLKYPGLQPWQIWISESQERMTIAIPPRKWKKFSDLVKRRGVEATIIGKFTDSGKCVVEFRGKKIMDISMDFLHNGLPSRPMQTTFSYQIHEEPKIKQKDNLNDYLLNMLKRLNIASYEFISQQYDHEVQGGAVIKPLHGKGRVNGDATVTRPLLSSRKGIALSQGIAPNYSDINTYHMAACVIDTSIRNLVAVGASFDKIALLDNFCWCSSTEPERLGQLKRAVQTCYKFALAYNAPFISGKDSMFNDFKGYDKDGHPINISIPPTLLISSISVMDDVAQAVSMDLKFPGDLIYVVGDTHDEMGASELFTMIGDEERGIPYIGNAMPHVMADTNKKMYRTFSKATKQKLISSAQSVGRGGLGIALAKKAIAGQLGLDVSLKNLSGSVSNDLFALFSESQGRIVVTVPPAHRRKFELLMHGNGIALIGKVTDDSRIMIKGLSGKTINNLALEEVTTMYKSVFKDY